LEQEELIFAPEADGSGEGSGDYDPKTGTDGGVHGDLEDGECSGIWVAVVSDHVNDDDACSTDAKRARVNDDDACSTDAKRARVV
jgi:hypothetical protein